jgi:hypothetical protein
MRLTQDCFTMPIKGYPMFRYAMICTLLAAISESTLADPQPWMKRERADTLGLYAQVHSTCVQFDINDLVRNVLLRHRMNPVSFVETADLWLDVQLHCIDSGTAVRSFLLNIEFHTSHHGPEMIFSSPYGGFGRSDIDGIRLQVRDRVEIAITDYLKAQTLY